MRPIGGITVSDRNLNNQNNLEILLLTRVWLFSLSPLDHVRCWWTQVHDKHWCSLKCFLMREVGQSKVESQCKGGRRQAGSASVVNRGTKEQNNEEITAGLLAQGKQNLATGEHGRLVNKGADCWLNWVHFRYRKKRCWHERFSVPLIQILQLILSLEQISLCYVCLRSKEIHRGRITWATTVRCAEPSGATMGSYTWGSSCGLSGLFRDMQRAKDN